MKLKQLDKIKPGSYIHSIDTGFPDNQVRIYYYIVDKRRKPKPLPAYNGKVGIPVRNYGFKQGHINTFHINKASHTYLPALALVKQVRKDNWKPKD